jgi:Zn-finger protein
MSLESKAKSPADVFGNCVSGNCPVKGCQNCEFVSWVTLKETQKIEETCNGLARDLQETIDTAAEIIRDFNKEIDLWNTLSEEQDEKIAEANRIIDAFPRVIESEVVYDWLERLRETLSDGNKPLGEK